MPDTAPPAVDSLALDTTPTADNTAAEAPAPSAPPPSAPTPSEAEVPQSLTDAVLSSIPPEKLNGDDISPDGETAETPARESPSQAAQSKDATLPDSEPPLDDEPSQAELDSYKPAHKGRVKSLLKERYNLRQENTALKANADRYKGVTQALDLHKLDPRDVELAMHVVSTLSRGDFKTFLESIGPYVNMAEHALGVRLPPDLAQQVEQGYISGDLASELAARRMQVQVSQGQLQQQAQQYQAQQAAEATQSVQQAVTHWETALKGRDPDYARKAGLLEMRLKVLLQEQGQPPNASGAIALCERALQDTETQLQTIVGHNGARQSTRPMPSSSNTASNSARPAPASLGEAMMTGLMAARR